MANFFNKHIKKNVFSTKRLLDRQYVANKSNITPILTGTIISQVAKVEKPPIVMENNKENKKIEDMTTFEKIQQANAILEDNNNKPKYKKVKKDKGLIERTESSKVILTEDNRELLND